jgi:hypothetical protein
MSFFFFFFFSYIKSENSRAEQILPGGLGNGGREEEVEKGWRRVNIV